MYEEEGRTLVMLLWAGADEKGGRVLTGVALAGCEKMGETRFVAPKHRRLLRIT